MIKKRSKKTTVISECGLCNERYKVELKTGEIKMLECPKCGNKGMQQLVGA